MKKLFTYIIICVSILASVLCALPLMSIHVGGMENGTLFVRGYNLIEFSAWGCIPVLAVLFVPVILRGSQPTCMQETELLLLFAGSIVCYVHSFNAARAWLYSAGDSLIYYYPGAMLYPVAVVGTFVAAVIFRVISENNLRLKENEVSTLYE